MASLPTASAPPLQPADPAGAYRALVAAGEIREDAAQASVVQCLQGLHEALAGLGKKKLLRRKAPLRGLYLWGNVGRGKSMLMNLFFAHAPVAKKRRVHFHQFMQEAHARIHELRKTTQSVRGSGDPVALFTKELYAQAHLLCFDELQASDVADASLIHRIFEGLLDAGVVIVSTSNHPPENLYTGGVQRERFNKLVGLIRAQMDVAALTSPHDYRTQQIRALTRTYFSSLGRDAEMFIDSALKALAPNASVRPMHLRVQGRTLTFAAYDEGVVLSSFRELCESPLGPADYLALAAAMETLVLTGIPALTPEKRNEAKRFVTLIDALYEAGVKLICTAAAEPEKLYPEGDGSFEFARTASRLREMQGEKYLAR